MAEVKVVIKPDFDWTPRSRFPVMFVWRELYLQGGTSRPHWSDPNWDKHQTIWHIVGSRGGGRAICASVHHYGRRALTIRELLEVSRWKATEPGSRRFSRLCKSCERAMNAKARERGVR